MSDDSSAVPPDAKREVEDGFGSHWPLCLRNCCGLEVVRPGKVQCWCDSLGGGVWTERDLSNDHIGWVGWLIESTHALEGALIDWHEELAEEGRPSADRLATILHETRKLVL